MKKQIKVKIKSFYIVILTLSLILIYLQTDISSCNSELDTIRANLSNANTIQTRGVIGLTSSLSTGILDGSTKIIKTDGDEFTYTFNNEELEKETLFFNDLIEKQLEEKSRLKVLEDTKKKECKLKGTVQFAILIIVAFLELFVIIESKNNQ